MFKVIQLIIGFLFFSTSIVVLGQECNVGSAVSPTTSHLKDNNDGTVSDNKTGLVWKKCSEGQNWIIGTNSCTNNATEFSWKSALQQAVDVNNGTVGGNLERTNWRVPNIKELLTIMERQCWSPSINLSVFPATALGFYWTSSPMVGSSDKWKVNFNGGYWGPSNHYVRLVR